MIPRFPKRKKTEFPVKIFIAAALANLFLAALLIIFFRALIAPADKAADERLSLSAFNNQNFSSGDPLLTKIPGLSDLITRPLANSGDPSAGAEGAPVVIALFSDFQCSQCFADLQASLKAVNEFPEKVKFIWKDFPEADIDSPTWKAALAGRCAAEQGDFFGYALALYSENAPWDDNLFSALAGRIGFNERKFKDCFLGREKTKFIIDNLTEAEALGISGVPTVYINNKKLTGEVRYENLKEAVEEELKK
ncbi:MAG: thioredoxin domain-containing protein [Patescibacteria group bacterium]|jgi:predicted DsbA family dithiol-disulfide isomerase